MATIIEDYVSFETAKLLKEKGFDIQTLWFYREIDKGFDFPDDTFLYYWNRRKGYLSAPTLQMACKWLREVHHLYIQVMLDSWACGGHMGYYIVIQNTTSDFEIMLQDFVDDVFYDTYEQACETALKYCLEKLI